MERKIGETFEFEGKKIEVKVGDDCYNCILDERCAYINKEIVGKCKGCTRNDGKDVIFVEVQEQPKKGGFNPKTLQPFDKVIVRIDEQGIWCCELFSFIEEGTNLIKGCGAYYKYCIPYNDDTKHLVGTTEEAPEFYRYWED